MVQRSRRSALPLVALVAVGIGLAILLLSLAWPRLASDGPRLDLDRKRVLPRIPDAPRLPDAPIPVPK